jgi:TonB family protein
MGRKVNGLRGLDPLSWHVKASYEEFDQDGKSKDTGTYEEWWVSARQYKLVLHSPQLSLEEYGTDHGIFRSGGQDWPTGPAGQVPMMIMQPVSARVGGPTTEFKSVERTFGSSKLPCTALVPRSAKKIDDDATEYCFASKNGVLLYSSSMRKAFQTMFQHISIVHGQYVAREIQAFLGGRPWLSIHVDTVESLDPSHPPDFTVPASGLPVKRRSDATGVIQEGALIKRAVPEYPVRAKAEHVEGIVIVSALLGTDGHIKKADALAGPPLLQAAATDAVKKWEYSPSLMDGEPVEIGVMVRVEFRLGG